MVRANRWPRRVGGGALALGAACVGGACLLAPAPPAGDFRPCTISGVGDQDMAWERAGDAFTRAEARALSVWHQANEVSAMRLRKTTSGDGTGAGELVYAGPRIEFFAFDRPQLFRDGTRLLINGGGAFGAQELGLDPDGRATSGPRPIQVVPPLDPTMTLGGPSGGAEPRAVASARAVSAQDLRELALINGVWVHLRTIPRAELGVDMVGTASLDGTGRRIVFMGRRMEDSVDQVLTSTRVDPDAAFATATLLLGAVTPMADPWIDDACEYLYLSDYQTTEVRRWPLLP